MVQKCVDPSTAHKKCASCTSRGHGKHQHLCSSGETSKRGKHRGIGLSAYQLGWLLDAFGHQQVGPTTLNGWLYWAPSWECGRHEARKILQSDNPTLWVVCFRAWLLTVGLEGTHHKVLRLLFVHSPQNMCCHLEDLFKHNLQTTVQKNVDRQDRKYPDSENLTVFF